VTARARLAGAPGVPLVAVVAVLVALGATGCGGSDPHAIVHVKQTVRAALAAVAAGNGPAFCDLATPHVQATLAATDPGSSCADVVDRLGDQLSAEVKLGMSTAVVHDVVVLGDRATVHAADISSTQGVLSGFLEPQAPPTTLTRQRDGQWKISS
jgi:hypothetical protein